MLSTSLVDLENITATVPRSAFSEDELNNLAQLILKAGGLTQVILLKKTGVETCEIVEGNFEYYATLRASELDPANFETIRGFIIAEDKESIIKEQRKLIIQVNNFQRNYKDMTKKQLVDLIKEKNIKVKGISKLKKVELVKILEQADLK